ncbi:hypothetical protein CVT25_009790 [Psilocybe cyanescens]|uniref:REJ domain-containing protein n=1 Tax=Psilocybe cyanescens TaxID=93625 RepID=A0A409X876_PSICY|nr:hypothetical protein CVT25_009790 [Psilocybe cyanescens]
MAADGCVQTPTLTRTNVVTSESIFTTTSVSTSIFPGSLSTSVFSTCTQTNSSIPCVSTRTSSVFTLPGSTSLTTIQVTGTSEVPLTSFVTLFGTTCSTSISSSTTPSSASSSSTSTTPTPDPPSNSSNSNTPTPTPSPNPTSSGPTSSSGNSNASTNSASSTTSNTGTSFSSSSTSAVPPTTTTTHSETAGGTLQTDTSNHGSKKTSNTGPIVGGVLGGLIALVIVAFLTWKYVKNQRRYDDIFDPDIPKPHYQKAKIAKDPEPKPYTYGLVGQNTTNPIGISPPSSPPPGQNTFNNIGHQGGNDIGQQGQGSNGIGQGPGSNGIGQGPGSNGIGQQSGNNMGYPQGNDIGLQPNQVPPQHIRNPSLTPLLAGAGFALAGSGASAATASSRPSSADSTQPIGPLVTNAPQGQGGYPPLPHSVSASSYPPALQNWNNTQGYAPQQQQQQGGTAPNVQGYGSGPSMAGPSSSSSNPLSQGGGSIGSMGSGSTAPSSWGGGPSAGGSGGAYTPALPGMVPLIATSASAARNTSYNSNNRVSVLQQYEDPFARTGSPVSMHEAPRILQVTNAEPETLDDSMSIYESGPSVAGPSGSGSGSAAANTASQAQAGSSSSSAGGAAGGSGRPLSARAEKAGLVHLDGGLYQTPAPGPPAYTES